MAPDKHRMACLRIAISCKHMPQRQTNANFTFMRKRRLKVWYDFFQRMKAEDGAILCLIPILCDIHLSAKSVWQTLCLQELSQWPLTLVCPDTHDECLQNTVGKLAAMSSLYCLLPRMGTVSIIKQRTLKTVYLINGEANGDHFNLSWFLSLQYRHKIQLCQILTVFRCKCQRQISVYQRSFLSFIHKFTWPI